MVENQTGKKIKTLRTDNGDEFCNKRLGKLPHDSGIEHQRTVPFTPEQNGQAERLNRSILEWGRCLLIESNLPNNFWAEEVFTAVYLINLSPCKNLNRTPEEIWSGKKHTIKHIKMFGCKGICTRICTHIPKQQHKKLDPKSRPCILIGYSVLSKAYRLYNPQPWKRNSHLLCIIALIDT